LTAAVVDDAGRLLDVCDVGDDPVGYAELGALLAERSGGAGTVAVAADSDEHHVTLLLAAAGRPLAIVDDEMVGDYADRFADDDSLDEMEAGPAERNAVGLARALQAGALAAASQSAPRELMALKPVLAAHAAVAVSRHGTAVALREVLRELYPAALRAYPDPAEAIPLAILDALPEPGLLGANTANRGRDAVVATELATAGVADAATISDAITALRVAIAETPRRTGVGKGTTTAVAETIREAVAAVRACDAAIGALVGLLSDKASAPVARPFARIAPAVPAVAAAPAASPAPPATPVQAEPNRFMGLGRRGRAATAATPAVETPPPVLEPLGRTAARMAGSRASALRPSSRPAPGAGAHSPGANGVRGGVQTPAAATAPPLAAPVAPPQVAASQAMPPQAMPPHVAPPQVAAPSVAPPPQVAPPAVAIPAVTEPPIAPAVVTHTVVAPHVTAEVLTPAASVPPPPPGITPIFPGQRPTQGQRSAMAPMPVVPTWQEEPVQPARAAHTNSYEANGYADLGPVEHPGYAAATRADGYEPTGYEPTGYTLAPDVTAPGSREAWPLNPPSYDDAAVTARPAPSYAPPATHQAPPEPTIPRQRDGRVAPPWQADDMALPPEPPALRLVEPDPAPPVPALRLISSENGRPSRAESLRGGDGMRGDAVRGDGMRSDATRSDGLFAGRERDDTRSPYPAAEHHAAPLDDGRGGWSPAADATEDGDLLIFAQARSAWFVGDGEELIEPPRWSEDPIDMGWSAALRAEHPEVGDETEVGLPRRVPAANLVPGSPLPPMVDHGLRIVRDPASMAAHTTGYFRGSRRGEEVRGYAVGGRPGREAGGGWDFSRDGWDSEQDTGYRSAAHR
jgi:hypothetical protein